MQKKRLRCTKRLTKKNNYNSFSGQKLAIVAQAILPWNDGLLEFCLWIM